MAKIFEVDFTKFDPPESLNAVDNVGGQTLTEHTGNLVKQDPLPTFNFRPGIKIEANGTEQNYSLRNSSSNASWHGEFAQRSWVIWFYTTGVSPDPRSALWLEALANSDTTYNGLRGGAGNPEDLVLWLDTSSFTIATDIFITQGWHNIIVTMDKGIVQTRAYVNGVFHSSYNQVTPSSPNHSSMVNIIGDNGTARESNLSLGYIATYDHVLNVSEVSNIYNSFLNDSSVGETAVATLSGAILDENLLAVSGADVFLLDNDAQRLISRGSSDSSGFYQLVVPFLGDYTVVASRPPLKGSVAEPFTVSSGGIITFHNDE